MNSEELYTIKKFSAEDTTISATVVFNKEHWIYQAHFPGRPVTPGAIVLQVAEELINKGTGKIFKLVSSKNIRFFSVISPDSGEICFKISFKKVAENWVEIGKNVGISAAGPSDVCRILDVTCDVSGVSDNTSYAKISALYNCY